MLDKTSESRANIEFLVKMNKTAIPTFNFLGQTHREKRQGYLKQSDRTSGAALKIGELV